LWSKQEEVLWSLRNNARTAVKSGNTVGKSFIAADAVMDFLTVNYPSKVLTTAPTWTQIEEILWKEIASYYNSSKIPIGGDLLNTEIKFDDEWFALGLSTNEVNRFQGFHSPNLLVVIDEALGVNPMIWEAINGLHPKRILAIGNPLEAYGDFFNCFSSPLWHKITISCEECVKWQNEHGKIPGLVTQQWINEREEEYGGRSSGLFQARVLGEFPEESEDVLISRAWVEKARHKANDGSDGGEIDIEEDSVRICGADVATKHGACETVVGYRYGHTLKEMKGYLNIPTTQTVSLLQRAYTAHKTVSPVVDSDGVGEGVADMLIAQRVGVIEFHGGYGQKAFDTQHFKNLRSQFYWVASKKFEKGLYSLKDLPEKEYQLLKNQLCSIKRKPVDPLGRIQVETKEDMIARGLKSPDYADTFMMLEFGWWMARNADIKPYKYR